MNFQAFITFLIVIVLTKVQISVQSNASCIIDLTDNPETYPVFLNENDEIKEVTLKNGVPVIEVPVNGFVRIICSGIGNRVVILGTGALVVDLTCTATGKFRVDEGFYHHMKELMCFRVPESLLRAKRDEPNHCPSGDNGHEIGFFKTPAKGFIRFVAVCRTPGIQRVRFARFIMRPDAGFTQTRQFPFRGSDTRFYTDSLVHLQNITNLHPKYSFDNITNLLIPALLANNSFFPFASQNRATFFYFNAAPQWRTFNAGNWRKVEDLLMTVAKNAVVYIGVTGQLNFDRNDGSTIPVFMDMRLRLMPVPEFFYAYVNHQDGRSFFVAGTNDIFLTEQEYEAKGKTFCEVVACTEIDWTGSSQIFCCNPTEDLLKSLRTIN